MKKMVKIFGKGVYIANGTVVADSPDAQKELAAMLGSGNVPEKDTAKKATMAYSILSAHNTSGNDEKLKIKFDSMASHDITYVGIVQTARASGLEKFPIPYVLTNCHNSLCAVGGTINEDDHLFGLSAAKKYGGIYVPAHQAVIHQYMREMMSGGGKMILGSDSHTRYGALGTMAVGEGGPELVKQLLGKTYDIDMPEVVAVQLTGSPAKGVGPQDVALAIIGAVFGNGYVKNKVMEFVGSGISNLSAEYRMGIDVMTTETTCLSSIWETDQTIKDYYTTHGRPQDYKETKPGIAAYYDGLITVDLSLVKPMIAMPFHPSNTYTIDELNSNLDYILGEIELAAKSQLSSNINFSLRDKVKNGRLLAQQCVIAGCAGGTFENICDSADILAGKYIGADEMTLSVYPSSQPVFMELVKNGAIASLMATGAIIKTAFCGPCFGAGDVPANNTFSIRHSTRNFPNREGSKPGDGQISSVALMDARSIAATAANGGKITPATDIDANFSSPKYYFNAEIYEHRNYNGFGKANSSEELRFGPNIADWPKMQPLANDIMLKVASFITDPVTTTDELIPSGETSSYRSNPIKLASFALSRKDPEYVGRAQDIQKLELARLKGENPMDLDSSFKSAFEKVIAAAPTADIAKTGIGSLVYAIKPGDGSAREQAASCQKVLGTFANIAQEYATKRYRSNLINWGMLPFILDGEAQFNVDDYIFVPGIRAAVESRTDEIPAFVVCESGTKQITLKLAGLTDDERQIILDGCLINYYNTSK